MKLPHRQSGLTVLEILISVAVGALLLLSLSGAMGRVLDSQTESIGRAELLRDGHFAMDRMLSAVRESKHLLLPLADNPATGWREHVRVQTVPASTPESGSLLATAVLAVTLPANVDLDADGWADANNDRDYLDTNGNSSRDPDEAERIDEDLPHDNTQDAAPGILGIDDDGDGLVDVSTGPNPERDNDEDGLIAEDSLGGGDADGDGAVDEDIHQDMNKDVAPGVAGVDDDLDGNIDEGLIRDDDEDGVSNEDWFDPLVFRLQAGELIERQPVPYDVTGDSLVNGIDFIESVIAENVTRFRVKRVPAPPGGSVTVDIVLESTNPAGDQIRLHSIARVGGFQ